MNLWIHFVSHSSHFVCTHFYAPNPYIYQIRLVFFCFLFYFFYGISHTRTTHFLITMNNQKINKDSIFLITFLTLQSNPPPPNGCSKILVWGPLWHLFNLVLVSSCHPQKAISNFQYLFKFYISILLTPLNSIAWRILSVRIEKDWKWYHTWVSSSYPRLTISCLIDSKAIHVTWVCIHVN